MTWDDYMRQHGWAEYEAQERYREGRLAEGHKPDCAEVVWAGDCDCGLSKEAK